MCRDFASREIGFNGQWLDGCTDGQLAQIMLSVCYNWWRHKKIQNLWRGALNIV